MLNMSLVVDIFYEFKNEQILNHKILIEQLEVHPNLRLRLILYRYE